jgi:hypothetical protein
LVEIMRHLETFLAQQAPSAAFRLADRESADDFEWIECRRIDASGTALLSVSHAPSMHTVGVELWWPERLAKGDRIGAPGVAIEHQRFGITSAPPTLANSGGKSLM